MIQVFELEGRAVQLRGRTEAMLRESNNINLEAKALQAEMTSLRQTILDQYKVDIASPEVKIDRDGTVSYPSG